MTCLLGLAGALLLQAPAIDAQARDFCSSWPACCYPEIYRGCLAQLADGRRMPGYDARLTLAAALETSVARAVQQPAGSGQSWSVVEGELPPGLSLSPEGVITGVPSRAGVWEATVRVETPEGSATRRITLTVRPVVEIDAAPPPAGLVGQPYSFQLRVVLRVELETTI